MAMAEFDGFPVPSHEDVPACHVYGVFNQGGQRIWSFTYDTLAQLYIPGVNDPFLIGDIVS